LPIRASNVGSKVDIFNLKAGLRLVSNVSFYRDFKSSSAFSGVIFI
jgi:hypothetical protein